MSDQQRMVKVADMWERVSARGTRYFSGYAGPVQYLLFDGGMRDHPTKPGEQVHVWRLMVQEADPDRRPQRREQSDTDQYARGQQTHEALRERAGALAFSPTARDEHEAVLAEAFDRRPPDDPPF